jgi:hypothetical protein
MSSFGTSTTAARRLPTAAGTGKVDGAATASTVVAVITIAACCGSATFAACCGPVAVDGCRGSATVAAYCSSEATAAPREPSLATVAVLPAARDALDERHLVGTTASDLSTLVGARGARWAPPCEHESKKVKPSPVSKT